METEEKKPERGRRGKVRDENLRDSILKASAELLFEVGFKRFTIEGVAARAHASKVTIYKWLTSKGVLALDGYVHAVTAALVFPQTDSPRKDIERQLTELIHGLTSTPAGKAMVELIGAAQEDPDLKRELNIRYIQPRREIAAPAFAKFLGWDPVERREDLFAVQDQVYGAIYNRLLFGLTPLDDGFARRLLEFWVPSTPVGTRVIYLVRHGETDWNAMGRLQGTEDVPLNAKGEAQARDLAEAFRGRGLEVIVTSRLSRAARTAEILAESLHLSSPRVFENLHERDYGEASGLTPEERSVRFSEGRSPQGQESASQLRQRVAKAFFAVHKSFPDKKVLIVTHGAVINSLIAHFTYDEAGTGKTRIINCSVSKLVLNEGEWKFEYVNLKPEEIADHEPKIEGN